MADNYADPFYSRADRLKDLWKQDAGRAGVDAYKRRAVLEREYARESPDTPIRDADTQVARGPSN